MGKEEGKVIEMTDLACQNMVNVGTKNGQGKVHVADMSIGDGLGERSQQGMKVDQ